MQNNRVDTYPSKPRRSAAHLVRSLVTFAKNMKLMIMVGRAILASMMWCACATAVFIGFLFAAKPFFEPEPNSRGEVAHFLTDMVLVLILTLVTILLLAKKKRKVEAISVVVIGLLVGAFMLIIFTGFGGFQILLGR